MLKERRKIILVNPPNPPHTVSNKDMMGGFGQLYSAETAAKIPPIDLPYTAAILRECHFSFDIVDCLALNYDIFDLVKDLKKKGPDIIAIRTSTPTINWDLKVAESVKKSLDTKIIFFGPHVMVQPQDIIKHPAVDALSMGEPELTLPEIAKNSFHQTKGLWYKDGSKVIKSESIALIEDINSLPFPAWDLLPYEKYDGGETNRKGKPFLTILTSRGCPYACHYCPYPVAQGRKWRARSSDNVVEELEYLIKQLGAKTILFRDPEFTLSKKRTVEICQKILEKDLNFSWRCETRIDHLDEDLIALMGRAGCFGINIGIESVNDQVLLNLERKPFPLEKANKIIDTCKQNNIEAFCFFIIGLPGETRESINKMIEFAIQLNPSYVQFTVATPYPGTKLEKWCKEHGYIQDNFSLEKITGSVPIIRNEYLTVKEIDELRKMAYQRFNLETKGMKRILNRLLWHIKNFHIVHLLKGGKTFSRLILIRLMRKIR